MCNGDDGGQSPEKNPMFPDSFEKAGTDFRVGVAWTDERKGFLEEMLPDDRDTDWGIVGMLDGGMTIESSIILSVLECKGLENMFFCLLALGVAEICTDWKSGFRIGFLDSKGVSKIFE